MFFWLLLLIFIEGETGLNVDIHQISKASKRRKEKLEIKDHSEEQTPDAPGALYFLLPAVQGKGKVAALNCW